MTDRRPGKRQRPHIGAEVVLDSPAFIDPSAQLFGRIRIGAGASVWPNVVMRSEMHEIRIGARSNVQDFVMIHVGYRTPTIVGEDCSITHHATLHGCEIGDRCLIGINATVMDGARIGANSIVAGHCIVGEGQVFPDNSVIAGVPGKNVATRDNSAANLMNARFYQTIAQLYAAGGERLSAAQLEQLDAMLAGKHAGD
ncbi:gamma carbonic anhydrase family protein [Piscinibacter sakaiensis]|uniref:gamma carbonic anhydrase family protein n=1 Tax=Piscinibacter sakaiensis TaxID=1547922 RepID=UPI003AAB18A1